MSLELTRCPDAEAVAARAADLVAGRVREAVGARGVAHLALSGGSIMAPFHEALARADVDWAAVHLWFSDERAVGPDSDDANFKPARETLLDHVAVPEGHVHRVRGEEGADAAAAAYEADVRALVPDTVFDVVMCGLGPDGHTCSLFPGHPEVREHERLVVGVHGSPKPPPDRISFTMPLLHAARRLVLLAAGAEKADAMAKVLAGPDEAVPASLLALGALDVVADAAAAPG